MNFIEVSHRIEIKFWNTVVIVMNNPPLLRAIFLGTVLTFFVGMVLLGAQIWVQFSADEFSDHDQEGYSTSAIRVEPPDDSVQRQYNTLLIMVDQFASGEGSQSMKIDGVWLAAYLDSTVKLSLVPIYPGGTIDESIEDIRFRMRSEGALDVEIYRLLKSIDVHWDHYVILETETFRELIRLLGDESTFNLRVDRRNNKVMNQAAQFNYICHHAGDYFQSRETYKLVQLFSSRVHSDLSPAHVLELWRNELTDRSRFSCEFPTLGDLMPAQYAIKY
jgi:hypothetical protein